VNDVDGWVVCDERELDSCALASAVSSQAPLGQLLSKMRAKRFDELPVPEDVQGVRPRTTTLHLPGRQPRQGWPDSHVSRKGAVPGCRGHIRSGGDMSSRGGRQQAQTAVQHTNTGDRRR